MTGWLADLAKTIDPGAVSWLSSAAALGAIPGIAFSLQASLLQVLLQADPGAAADPSLASQIVESLKWGVNLLLHLDDEMKKIIAQYGLWAHLILFVVIFCETGLVFTPFLPGDSLLFAAGAFAADRSLRIEWLLPLLIVAAIAGDTVNYWMGRFFGVHAFSGRIPFLNHAQLEKTQRFFQKYGGKTIILARFVPFARTFAPFVAGMGSMNYRLFFLYNVVGGIAWVLIFVPLGYYFGTIELVQKNFELVMVGIVGISLLPPAWEFAMHWMASRKQGSPAGPQPASPTES